MKSYIVYTWEGGFGGVYMTHDKPYNTSSALENLRNYISRHYIKGKRCIIVNIIKLEDKENGQTD